MDNQKILGIDIGATKVHIGVVQEGTIIDEVKFPTSSKAPKAQILEEITEGIAGIITPDVEGIGIGVPGLYDEEKGVVYDIQNIPSWQEVFLKKHLEDRFKRPVAITNDANTFVLGEKIYGKAKGYKNVVGITLGTGLGAGIIIHNELYSGAYSSAGELGIISYLDKTIEDYCSGKFFQSKGLSGLTLFEMAKKGDKNALEMFSEFGGHVGNMINTVLFILSPQAILLGGSVNKCYPFFKSAMEAVIETFPFKRVTRQVVIAPSELSNAAILGAAALIKMRKPALQ